MHFSRWLVKFRRNLDDPLSAFLLKFTPSVGPISCTRSCRFPCPDESAGDQGEIETVETTVFPSAYGCGAYDVGWPIVTVSDQARPAGFEPATCGLEDGFFANKVTLARKYLSLGS